MSNKPQKTPYLEILIAIASTIFGLLISPLLERILDPAFETFSRALLTSVAILSILIVISIVVTSIYAKRSDEQNTNLQKELILVSQRLGLTVRFVHDPPKRSTGNVYVVAREIVERAEREILVLQYSRLRDQAERDRSRFINTDRHQVELQNYTKAITGKVQALKDKGFVYKRVVQFPEGKDTKYTPERVGERQFRHVEEIIQALDTYPEAGYVKKSALFLEQTYLIVDRKYVIWGFDAIDPEYDVRYTEGALIFEDPHQEFINYLVSFFERVDRNAVIIKRIPEF